MSLDYRLPELHRVRVKHRGDFICDRSTACPDEAKALFERYAAAVRAGLYRGHASWSSNGFLRQWAQTPEVSA